MRYYGFLSLNGNDLIQILSNMSVFTKEKGLIYVYSNMYLLLHLLAFDAFPNFFLLISNVVKRIPTKLSKGSDSGN